MKKQNFSLIEILVVIGLIGILAGLAFPAYNSIQRRAKENAAVAGCNTLAMSIKQFETTYSKYPTNVTISDKTPIGGTKRASAADAYENLLETLTGTTAGTTTTNWVGGNSRKIKFLDPGPDYIKSYNNKNSRHGSFTNPWGQRFWVYWNISGDNKIEFKRPKDGALSNNDTITLLSDIAVFCELDPVGPYYKKGTRLATSWGGMKDFE